MERLIEQYDTTLKKQGLSGDDRYERIEGFKIGLRTGADPRFYHLNPDAHELGKKIRDEIINHPELRNFVDGVVIEAQHQKDRWGNQHDKEKTAWDWFWLIGYVSQKAFHACNAADWDRALHHAVTSAAVMANFHRQIVDCVDGKHTGLHPAMEIGSANIPQAANKK